MINNTMGKLIDFDCDLKEFPVALTILCIVYHFKYWLWQIQKQAIFVNRDNDSRIEYLNLKSPIVAFVNEVKNAVQ